MCGRPCTLCPGRSTKPAEGCGVTRCSCRPTAGQSFVDGTRAYMGGGGCRPPARQQPAMHAFRQAQRPRCARVWHLTGALHEAGMRLPRSAAGAAHVSRVAGWGSWAALRACKVVLPQQGQRPGVVGPALGACVLPVPTCLSRPHRMPQLQVRMGRCGGEATGRPAGWPCHIPHGDSPGHSGTYRHQLV